MLMYQGHVNSLETTKVLIYSLKRWYYTPGNYIHWNICKSLLILSIYSFFVNALLLVFIPVLQGTQITQMTLFLPFLAFSLRVNANQIRAVELRVCIGCFFYDIHIDNTWAK